MNSPIAAPPVQFSPDDVHKLWKKGSKMSSGVNSLPRKKPMIKPSHRGLLHKDLGVPQGQKIPVSKIQAAKHSKSAAIRKRANFAMNFGH